MMAWGLVLGATGARGAVIYDLVELGPGTAVGLNNNRQVVLNDGGAAVLWEGGVRTTLFQGGAQAINDSGQVLGRIGPAGSQLSGVYQVCTGATTVLGTGLGFAQNELGQVVYSEDWETFSLWDAGTLTTLVGFPSDVASVRAINDAGMIGGARGASPTAFTYRDGEPAPAPGSEVIDINARGDLISYTEEGEWGSGTFQSADGWEIRLDPLVDEPYLPECVIPYALNDAGLVVGTSFAAYGGDDVQAGLIWEAGSGNGTPIDLNTLIDPSLAATWRITRAVGINNQGDILAYAYNIEAGRGEAVLLRFDPAIAEVVPEPAGVVLAVVGVAGAGLGLRRRRAGR